MSNYGLPDGVSLAMVAAVLVPVGIVTVMLRALPFSLRRVLKSSPFIDFLSVMMPAGVMTVLVAYTILGYAASPTNIIAALLALGTTLVQAPCGPLHFCGHRVVHGAGERRVVGRA